MGTVLLVSLGIIAFILLASITSSSCLPSYASPSVEKKKQVTLYAILEDQGDPDRWKNLIQPAVEEMRTRHPDVDIQINYTTYPYDQSKKEMLDAISNKSQVDLVSLDQIWLGEFVERGLLTDITDRVNNWGRISDLYESNLDGTVYNDRIYGIWAWTDVRGIWYWKDMISQAGVDPNTLKTWDGYIASGKKLNEVLRPQGIEGIHLTAASHSPDIWYPYLWMLGGYIIEPKDGHPTKGVYWFPAYNSSEGIRAMEFIKSQVDAGIKPQKDHYWGKEFIDRNFSVMIEGSWMPTRGENITDFEDRVGFIPMFPVPNLDNETSTLMGGWELAIPKKSTHKDLAWKLITLMLEPKILTPWLIEHRVLPTQVTIGEGELRHNVSSLYPYYDEMISAIPFGGSRPSIPEFPQTAHYIEEALNAVYYGTKQPKDALDDA